MSNKDEKMGCSGCLYTLGSLMVQFLLPFVGWILVALVLVGILHFTGYYEKANESTARDREKNKTGIHIEMERQMMEDAHDGMSGWEFIDR